MRHGREAQPLSELCIITSITQLEAKGQCNLLAILRAELMTFFGGPIAGKVRCDRMMEANIDQS